MDVDIENVHIHILNCCILSVYVWLAIAVTYLSEIRSIGVVGVWLDLALQLVFLVFGELVNHCSWVEILGHQLGRYHWILSLPIFLGLRSLAAGKNGHCLRFWEGSQPLRQVDVCDVEEWKDFRGSIYFQNGALTQHGRTMPAFPINITACFAIAGGHQPDLQEDCHFMVRPVFQCDDDGPDGGLPLSCVAPRACAWAITANTSNMPQPPQTPGCSTSGLCGFVTDLKQLMPGMLHVNASMSPFEDALETAGRHFPGLTAESPLLYLVNPVEVTGSLGAWVPIYYVLLFIYVPFGTLLAWLQPAWQSGCGGALQNYVDFLEGLSEDDTD